MCEVMLRIQQITGNKNRTMSFSFKKWRIKVSSEVPNEKIHNFIDIIYTKRLKFLRNWNMTKCVIHLDITCHKMIRILDSGLTPQNNTVSKVSLTYTLENMLLGNYAGFFFFFFFFPVNKCAKILNNYTRIINIFQWKFLMFQFYWAFKSSLVLLFIQNYPFSKQKHRREKLFCHEINWSSYIKRTTAEHRCQQPAA